MKTIAPATRRPAPARRKLSALLLVALFPILTARAGICTWTGGGGNNYWTNAANWGGTAPVSGDSLVFTGSTRLLTTNRFAAGTTFSNLTFDADAGAFTLNGNSFALTGSIINNSTSLQTLGLSFSCSSTALVNTASGNITINGVISGNCRLFKQGDQTLTLAGNNSYTVGTTIGGGILSISKDNLSTHQLGALNASCTLTFAGGSLAVTGGALYASTPSIQNWLLRNCVLGPGGGGVVSGVELGHENYSGIGENFTGGTPANGLTLRGGDITLRPGAQNTLGKLTVASGRCFLRNQHGNGYPLAGADQIEVSSGATLVFVDTTPRNVTNAMVFASGSILCNRTNGTASLSLETMTLSTASVTFPSAGQIYFNYDDQKTTNIVINGAWPALTGDLLIQVGGFNATVGPVALNGAISGDHALSTTGPLTLQAANFHTGGTTVAGGTLEVSADGGLGAGNVTVNNGAALTLNSGATNGYLNRGASLLLDSAAKANLKFNGTNTIAGLSFDGGLTYQSGGTWGAPGSVAANQDSRFTGAGVLNVVLPTATAVVSSGNPSAYGQPASFNATVTAPAGTPAGSVQFQTNGSNFGDPVTLSGGNASSGSLPARLSVGTYAVAAVYIPAGSFGASSGTLAGGQEIRPLAVSLTGTKTYDGTADAAGAILALTNALGGDDVGVASGSGTLAGTAAGSQAITSFGTLTLGGTAAGNYTLLGATGTVNITAGAITQLVVETAADGSGTAFPSQSLAKSNAVTMYAIARDGGGNFAGNISAAWFMTNAAGGFSAADLVPAAEGKSAVFTGHAPGMGTIVATTNGWSGQSGLLAVPLDPGLIRLPGFEGAAIVNAQPAGPDQTYWINGTNNNQYAQWGIEAGNGVGGSAAAVARPGPAAMGGSANYLQTLRTYYFPVWPGTQYTISFFYRAIGPGFNGLGDAAGSQLQFQALESPNLAGGGWVSTAGMNILNEAAGWSNGLYTFTTTAGTRCVCLKFGVMFGSGNQTNPVDAFYLDDDRGTSNRLAASANPAAFGQPISFTATVIPVYPAPGTPTGTVQFLTNGIPFGGAVALSGGSASSDSLPLSLPPGRYAVAASYSGDSNFTGGSGILSGGQLIYLPPEPGIVSGPAAGTNLIISWPGTADCKFTLQCTPSLFPAAWSNLPAYTGMDGRSGTMSVTNSAGNAGTMFYRIQMSH